jgi:GT2 family glycosyltransferase
MFDRCDCLGAGGRIIPVYESNIPPWLRLDEPFPFLNALVAFDFGNGPCILKTPPFGANMAFRREAFEKYGPFRVDLGPVKGNTMGKGEDSEFCSRLLAAGETMMYASDAVIFHPVEQERMHKNYFVAWYFNYGIAQMLRSSPPGTGSSYFGVPRFLIRQIITRFVKWVLTLDGHRRFCSKLQLYEAAGEVAGAYRKYREERKRGCVLSERSRAGLTDQGP